MQEIYCDPPILSVCFPPPDFCPFVPELGSQVTLPPLSDPALIVFLYFYSFFLCFCILYCWVLRSLGLYCQTPTLFSLLKHSHFHSHLNVLYYLSPIPSIVTVTAQILQVGLLLSNALKRPMAIHNISNHCLIFNIYFLFCSTETKAVNLKGATSLQHILSSRRILNQSE